MALIPMEPENGPRGCKIIALYLIAVILGILGCAIDALCKVAGWL